MCVDLVPRPRTKALWEDEDEIPKKSLTHKGKKDGTLRVNGGAGVVVCVSVCGRDAVHAKYCGSSSASSSHMITFIDSNRR